MLLPLYLCNISDHICGCRIQLHHKARNTLQNRAGKKVSEMEQAMSTLWCLSGIVSHKDFSKTFAYLFCDINLQNCSGAEGRGASVFGLDHQWPYAVFIVRDVVDDVQRSDIGFQLDFPSALVNVKHIGWICLHDGIIHNVVGLFRILVYSLVGEVLKTKVLLFVFAWGQKASDTSDSVCAMTGLLSFHLGS